MATFSRAATKLELGFDAKYYGPCPELAVDTGSFELLDQAVDIMAARKNEKSIPRCNVTFTKQGVVVCDRKARTSVAAWHATNVKRCETAQHPKMKSRRVGMLLIQTPRTNDLSWHLFKYHHRTTDNLTECFHFLENPELTGNLDDLDRMCDIKLTQHNETQNLRSPTPEPHQVTSAGKVRRSLVWTGEGDAPSHTPQEASESPGTVRTAWPEDSSETDNCEQPCLSTNRPSAVWTGNAPSDESRTRRRSRGSAVWTGEDVSTDDPGPCRARGSAVWTGDGSTVETESYENSQGSDVSIGMHSDDESSRVGARGSAVWTGDGAPVETKSNRRPRGSAVWTGLPSGDEPPRARARGSAVWTGDGPPEYEPQPRSARGSATWMGDEIPSGELGQVQEGPAVWTGEVQPTEEHGSRTARRTARSSTVWTGDCLLADTRRTRGSAVWTGEPNESSVPPKYCVEPSEAEKEAADLVRSAGRSNDIVDDVAPAAEYLQVISAVCELDDSAIC